MRKKQVTLKDIALATGLAINTVSKVINKKPYYTKDVEKKVLSAVKELGYIPNTMASSLRRGSSRTVAIVFDDLINPYYSMMTLELSQRFSAENYEVMIFSTYGSSRELKSSLLKSIIARNVDAVISFLEPTENAIELLTRTSTPFLLFGRLVDSTSIVSLYSDDYLGGKLAAEHLIAKGHKRVAYVGANPDISVDTLRLKGYRETLQAHGVELLQENIAYFSQYNDIEVLAREFLVPGDTTAAFCFNDIFCYGIFGELLKSGKRVPADYSLIGFDNIRWHMSFPVSLTTIGTQNEEMAIAAVEIVLDMLRNEDYSELLKNPYPVKLIQGETT